MRVLFLSAPAWRADREVQATAESVIATEFATVLGDREGPLVSTAEHVLAALRGMGVDNATIEIDGPEVPIMDGSAAPSSPRSIRPASSPSPAPRRFIQVLKPVQVAMGDSFGELRPMPTASAPRSKSTSPIR
jgi:UDP-3-O-[3-hydroxymyristoyl] N-acetylglucosamine deacetylase